MMTRLIRRDGARPVLFETWAIGTEMLRTSRAIPTSPGNNAPRVPVGDAWSTALAERPSLALWNNDGHHPTLEGSYLTAAAFSAAFDLLDPQRSDVADPALSTFTAGLNAGAAESLRQIAYDAVRHAFSSGTR
jgi:hypothetical protein